MGKKISTVLFIAVLQAGIVAAGVNRINPGLPQVSLFGTAYDNNNFSAMCVACHTRNPSVYTAAATGNGSHFVYGGAGLTTVNTGLEKTDAWSSGGLSKYGNGATNKSVTGQTGEMICESCHNLLINKGIYKLLVYDNESVDPSLLCEGCHARTGANHHPLTGDWSVTNNRNMTNDPLVDTALRNPPTSGSEATYPAGNGANCLGCHRGHDARTETGARILKRGYSAGAGAAVQGKDVSGLRRQIDQSNIDNTRLVTDFTPLCDACHKHDD